MVRGVGLPFTVSFVGVHGSGKTTTARRAVRDGFRMQSVEAIDIAFGLPPVERQTLFFTTYVNSFLAALNTSDDVKLVFDSHPLVVLPYTEYWLRKGGFTPSKIEQVLDAFAKIIELLPPVDLMVYLEADDLDIVVERIKRRARFSVSEEARVDYIEFIDQRLSEYLGSMGGRLARSIIRIRASEEVEKRYSKVRESMTRVYNMWEKERISRKIQIHR